MKRLFVSINLPEKTKKELKKQQEEINNSFPKRLRDKIFKWEEKEKLHITVAFLGDTKEKRIKEVKQILKEEAKNLSPFNLEGDKICYGPGKKIPPRLIWWKLKKNDKFINLAKGVQEKLYKNKLCKKPRKNIIPHVTLARIKKMAWKRVEPDERPRVERSCNLNVDINSLDIMESKLKRGGAEHNKLKSVKI